MIYLVRMKAAYPILLVILLCACSSSKTFVSTEWQQKPVVVDGIADEWQQPLRYANSDTQLNYSVTNDANKLYFCFMTTDPRVTGKIAMGGIQIRVAFPGTESRPATLIYPIAGRVNFPAHPKDKDGKAQPARGPMKFDLTGEAGTMQVSGFPFAQETTELPLLNNLGISVATNSTTEERFIYEVAMPLNGLKLNANREVDITITLKGIPKDKMGFGKPSAGGGGGVPGPGGSRTGRGAYGGGNAAYNAGYSRVMTDQKLNLSMKLAEK